MVALMGKRVNKKKNIPVRIDKTSGNTCRLPL